MYSLDVKSWTAVVPGAGRRRGTSSIMVGVPQHPCILGFCHECKHVTLACSCTWALHDSAPKSSVEKEQGALSLICILETIMPGNHV